MAHRLTAIFLWVWVIVSIVLWFAQFSDIMPAVARLLIGTISR